MSAIEPQYFKPNDPLEAQVAGLALPILEQISADKDEFQTFAYKTKALGQLLFDLKAAPLTSAIPEAVWLESFSEIIDFFQFPGTFEFYLTVFRAIWGEDVEVEFIVPGPGELEININALSIEYPFFMARRIVGVTYVDDEVVDHDDDNIVFQVAKGLQTQGAVDVFIKELVPAGIFHTVTLTIT